MRKVLKNKLTKEQIKDLILYAVDIAENNLELVEKYRKLLDKQVKLNKFLVRSTIVLLLIMLTVILDIVTT